MVGSLFRASPFAGCWLAVALTCAVDFCWLALSEQFSVDKITLLESASVTVVMLLLALYCRSRSHDEFKAIGRAAEGLMLASVAFIALRLLNHLTTSVVFPMEDDALANIDKTLGLSWPAYAGWVADVPALVQIFAVSYSNLSLLAIVVLLVLYCLGRADRAEEFIQLFFFCALASILIGMVFPAEGAMARYETPDMLAAFGPDAGNYALSFQHVLRSNAPHMFKLDEMPGLVIFPSFHTSSGLLIMYACRGMRFAAPVLMAYALIMIASTPIMGGHYFTDMLGGTLLTIAMISARRMRWRLGHSRRPNMMTVSAD